MRFHYSFKRSVRFRLIVIFSLAALIVTGGMAYFAASNMKDRMIRSAEEKVKSDLILGEKYLDSRYRGPWEIREGKLFKGPALMEGNYAIVDEIGRLTGD